MQIKIFIIFLSIITCNIITSHKRVLRDSILSNTFDYILKQYNHYIKDKWSAGTDYELIMYRVKNEKNG